MRYSPIVFAIIKKYQEHEFLRLFFATCSSDYLFFQNLRVLYVLSLLEAIVLYLLGLAVITSACNRPMLLS